MTQNSTVAGVILTLNEEANLSRALQSISWCDEILVLDSGSVDKTKDIALSYGATFLEKKPELPFKITDQRNWAIANCNLQSDWVLFIDADEEVGHALKADIICAINSPRYTAYELSPRYWFLGRWLKRTQGYPNWHPRLIKRGILRFEGGVWETFSKNCCVGRIYTPYEHYAFSKGLDDWMQRHLRYADWNALQVLEVNLQGTISAASIRYGGQLRIWSLRLWWLVPPLRFTKKYFIQLGFVEGWQSLIFCLMMFFYDLMTIIKVVEKSRTSKSLPL